jgi:hypothetical protein
MLKAEAWPLSRDAPEDDIGRLYHEALQALPETVDGQPPLPTQTEMPTLNKSDEEKASSASR